MKLNKTFIKRLTGLVCLAIIALVAVVGCSGEEKVVTYEGNFNGLEMSITYYANGDKVTKQTAVNSIPYTSIGATNKEEAQAILDSQSELYQGIDGLEESLEYGDDAVKETISIDFEKVDYEKVKSLPGMLLNGDPKSGISLEASGKALESSGFTKK